jgi:hypothetical protein
VNLARRAQTVKFSVSKYKLMSIDDQIDVTIDHFKWEVYVEMLETVDEVLSTEGYQSRFIGTEAKKLLRDFYGIDSTEKFPFLQHYIDFSDDDYSSAATLVHELSHNVLEQLENETEVGDYFSNTEETAQKLEAYYLRESTYLEEKGLKQQLIGEAGEINKFLQNS